MRIQSNIQSLHESYKIDNLLIRKLLAEFFGTYLLLACGLGVNAQYVLNTSDVKSYTNLSLGWGFAVCFAVYATYSISGAHLNPAVTVALFSIGRTSVKDMLLYIPVQYLGAFLGAASVYGVYYGAISHHIDVTNPIDGLHATASIFATYPAPYITTWNSLGDEIFSTMIFMIFILTVVDKKNTNIPNYFIPFLIGLIISWKDFGYSLNTGGALNPARDLGPRIFTLAAGWGTETFTYGSYFFWIPVVGTHIGAIVGAYLYQFFIGWHHPEDNNDNRSKEKKNSTSVM